MSETEETQVPEHPLDVIALKSWANIPKCITEALNLLIQQIKTTQSQLSNVSENHFVSSRQYEMQFNHFVNKTEANARDTLLNFDLLKDTVNRTLKNIASEVNETNALALDDRNKIKEVDLRTQVHNENIKAIQEKFESYEDREGIWAKINSLSDEMNKKFVLTDTTLRTLFHNKIAEVFNLPDLIGADKKYVDIKSLIREIYENYDKRSEAMMEILDNKDTFFKNNIAEMDLPNKVKSQIQGDIKSSIMKEVFVRLEMFAEKNKNELVKTLSGEKQLNMVESPTGTVNAGTPKQAELIAQMSETIKNLQERVYLLEHSSGLEGRKPLIKLQTNKKTVDLNTSKDSIGKKNDDFLDIPDFEVRGRSKSESKKVFRQYEEKKEGEAPHSIIEEDEEEELNGKLGVTKSRGILDKNDDFERRSNSVLKGDKGGSSSRNQVLPNINMSPGEKMAKAVKQMLNKSGRSFIVNSQNPFSRPIHSRSQTKDFEESFISDLNKSQNSFVQGVGFQKLNILEKLNMLDSQFSPQGKSDPDKPLDLSKFELGQLEPYTFEFLTVLENEFDSIYKALSEMQAQIKTQELPKLNLNNSMAVPDIQTRQRQSSISNSVRPTVIEKEIQPLPQPGSKLTAYNLLKAVTKKREEEDVSKLAATHQPAQNLKKKMPLIQIRPNGIKIAAPAQDQNSKGPQGYQPVPNLPTLALGRKTSKVETSSSSNLEVKDQDPESQTSSSLRNSNPRGNVSLASQKSHEKEINNLSQQSETNSKGTLLLEKVDSIVIGGNKAGLDEVVLERDFIHTREDAPEKDQRSQSQEKETEEIPDLLEGRKRSVTNNYDRKESTDKIYRSRRKR